MQYMLYAAGCIHPGVEGKGHCCGGMLLCCTCAQQTRLLTLPWAPEKTSHERCCPLPPAGRVRAGGLRLPAQRARRGV